MILALDVGTSSARAALYDESGVPVPRRLHRVAYEPTITADGGVEHDPNVVLAAVATCLDAVLTGPGLPDVAGVGVATFWHGLLGFDATGHAVTPIYMWADTRSAREATLLAGALDEAALHARTGCYIHTSYWPAKLRWLARERPAELQRVTRWGSIGEHLEHAFFGEAATSVSIASATGLFDHARLHWDPTALAAGGIETAQLFPLVDRHEPRRDLRSAWARRWPALRGVPWFPAVGDGAAGNAGSECVDPSRVAPRLDTTAAHIMRAMLEAVALRLGIVYELLGPCLARDHVVVASGGGFAHARTWAQIITDVLNRPITVLHDEEATSRGAALLALSALGRRPELASGRPPDGDTLRPDAARHAHYREALARQRALDAKLA